MNAFTYNDNRYSDNSAERLFNIGVIMVAMLAISMVAVNGQELTRGDLIGHPTGCQHVINLVHRHGVNHTFDRFGSANHLHHSPVILTLGSMMIPAAEMGDLEIISVHQFSHDDPACGPKIAVVVANQSSRCVKSFSVTAVAMLGRMHFDSPNQTVKVEEIKAGEALQVELVLPIESLAMGNRGGQPIGFQRLVIAIDSFDELAETDEANNIKAYAIASVPMMTVAVVQATETVSVDPLASEIVAPGTQTTTIMTPGTKPTPDGSSDPLQAAIDQLGTVATASGS